MATQEISNSEDVIDSRNVIARIDDLRSDLEAVHDDEAGESRPEGAESVAFDDWLTETASNPDHSMQDEAIEYRALVALADDAKGYADDWQYGAQLIRYDHFTDYCQQLCEDIGDLPKGFPDYIEIDWEATARNLKVDYTGVDFDGVTYFVR